MSMWMPSVEEVLVDGEAYECSLMLAFAEHSRLVDHDGGDVVRGRCSRRRWCRMERSLLFGDELER